MNIFKTSADKLEDKARSRRLRADELDRQGKHINARTIRKRAEKMETKATELRTARAA